MEFNSKEFRTALGTFATGVTVVTIPEQSMVHGMTANAFTSVSLDPPLILISVDKKTRSHQLIQSAQRFGVNILKDEQVNFSRYFSKRNDSLTEEQIEYCWIEGIPVLSTCLTSLACDLWASYDGGDHTLYIGKVISLSVNDGDPLIFYRSDYRKLHADSLAVIDRV